MSKNRDHRRADDGFVRLDDGDMHVLENGVPGGPALLLISNAAAPMAVWDPVIGSLAGGGFRVIRVDLLGSGKSSRPTGGYDIPTQARRISDALDKLGVSRVTAIGHSSGCMLVTALAEQRPGAVVALVLIDMGPSLDAEIPESPLLRLLLAPLIGPLLWRLKTDATIRKGARTSFTRPVNIPDAFVEQTQGMTHRAFVGAELGHRTGRESSSFRRRLNSRRWSCGAIGSGTSTRRSRRHLPSGCRTPGSSTSPAGHTGFTTTTRPP